MNQRYTNDDNPREYIHKIEKNYTIEKPDFPRFVSENFSKLNDKISVNEEIENKIEEIPIISTKKTKKSRVINEKNKSKNTLQKPKKYNSKCNKAAMASI